MPVFCVLLLAGCGTAPQSHVVELTGSERVTLHVPDMAERLALNCPDWPNEVQEALAGLPGVEAVDWDWKNDLLHVRYDGKQVTPAVLLEEVSKKELQGKIVPGGPWIVTVSQEASAMRSLLRSVLAFFALALTALGCAKSEPPPVPTDVTLHVPGMYWATGWPDRVRAALATLPWVEQTSIQMDVPSREVRFNLADKQAFDEDAVRKALQKQRFKEVTVKKSPLKSPP